MSGSTNFLLSLRSKRAFTLIEMLVVMLVVGVLLAVALPAYLGQQAKAQDAATKQYLTVAYKAAKAEAASNEDNPGSYPTVGLRAMLEANEPSLDFTDGTTCLDADSRPASELVYDTNSSSSSGLTMYGESDSGKVFRLTGPVAGPPVIDHICDGSVGGAGAAGRGGDNAPVPAVGGANPETSNPPAANGAPQPQVAVPITVDGGDWSSPDGNPTTTTYQWQVCTDAAGNGCENITGLGASDASDGDNSYTPTPDEVDDYLRAQVTVCGDGGCTVSYTAPAGPTLPAPPVLVGSAPGVSDSNGGSVVEGDVLNASTGDWAGDTQTPTSYAYQWFRCGSATDLNTCIQAGGAGNALSSYTPNAADVDNYLRVRVAATNAGGTTYSWSDASAVVLAAPPTLSGGGPTISGAASYPGTLTANEGAWTTSAPAGVTYSYQWQRCDSAGNNCVNAGTGSTYTIQSTDVGSTFKVTVTATNDGSGGSSSSETSPLTSAVTGAPGNTAAPSLSGTAQEGQTVSSSTGSWTPAATSYSYAWFINDVQVAATQDYTIPAGQAGKTIYSRVTATNASGSSAPVQSNSATIAAGPSVSCWNGTFPYGTTCSSPPQASVTLSGGKVVEGAYWYMLLNWSTTNVHNPPSWNGYCYLSGISEGVQTDAGGFRYPPGGYFYGPDGGQTVTISCGNPWTSASASHWDAHGSY